MDVVLRHNSIVGDGRNAPFRNDLYAGVTRSIEALGTGFLSHNENNRLRRKLGSGALSASEYYRQVLRISYRILFLFIAEDRGLLHPAYADGAACDRHDPAYSASQLRDLAATIPGSEQAGLWHALSVVTHSLGQAEGVPALGIPGQGSFLWSSDATADLLGPSEVSSGSAVLLRDCDLLDAIRLLCSVDRDGAHRRLDFCNLGTGAFGSLYESLLELRPEIDLRAGTFSLVTGADNERKTTGSYYTPDSLVHCMLDSALDPVIEDRLAVASTVARAAGGSTRAAQENAILNITVCDPACGTGHFLIAAAHRLARRLARVRSGEAEPSAEDDRRALADVIPRCIFGVDINPMAAELCRIALWIESNERGLQLSHLAGHIRVGNALLGATPALLHQGIPDEAFRALRGEDPKVVRRLRKQNAKERRDHETRERARLESEGTAQPNEPPVGAPSHTGARLLADAWCAAFVWPRDDTGVAGKMPGSKGEWEAMTEGAFRTLERDPHAVESGVADQINRLAAEHQFFHWHLEFLEVFGGSGAPTVARESRERCTPHENDRSTGGFDVVCGNPPFLNQLETATAIERGAAAIVRHRTGGVCRGLADLSATFLLLGTQLARPGGRVALVQPQSLLAARDAAPIRAAVLRDGTLCSLWISNEHLFPGASVFTCAPTIHKGGKRRGPLTRSATGRFTRLDTLSLDNDALMAEETWSHLAAAASGVPEVTIRSDQVVGDLAEATADFRDQYYGLEGFLIEDADLTPSQRAEPSAFPPIVTSGLIDLADCRWGRAPTRVLKRRWIAPRIDRDRMAKEGTLGGWISQRLVPKLLLATQTRVVEVIVDDTGRLIPSVPVVTMTLRDPTRLWHLASAIASPVCTAAALRKYAGTALNADSIKLSARQVLRLPLPLPSPDWDVAARCVRAASSATDPASRREALLDMGRASIEAYRVPPVSASPLFEWWQSRLRSVTAQ